MSSVFSQMNPGESLDHFHQRCVVPTPDETTRRNSDIDQFVGFLQREFGQRPYTVKEVVKSGSLGKGTAVRGSADIDLVVFLNGLTSIEDLREHRRTLLDRLEDKVNSYRQWQGRIQPKGRTSYFLSYWLDGQEMDILPAYDVLSDAGTPSAVYQKMKKYPQGTEQAGQQFSVSLAPLQIQFVKRIGEDVKRVIRLVKLWKKEKHVEIASYTVELITIHASKGMWSLSTNALFKEVMTRLRDCGSLRIAFDDNYNSHDYTRSLSPPYVLDPANPYMNTIDGVRAGDVSREAANTLRLL